jgi:hypothetical protein
MLGKAVEPTLRPSRNHSFRDVLPVGAAAAG